MNRNLNPAALAEQARYRAHVNDLRAQLAQAAGDKMDRALECVRTLQHQGETLIFALSTTIRIYDGQAARK